jgi:hypothetical protein
MTTGSNTLAAVAAELGELVAPLRRVVDDPSPPGELVSLLQRAGWALPSVDGAELSALTAAWSEVLDVIDTLPDAVRTDNLLDVVEALVAIAAAVQQLEGLDESLAELLETTGADPGAVAPALAEDLVHSLTLRWLGRCHPVALQLLRALRIVGTADVAAIAADGGVEVRPAGRRARLEPAAVVDLLTDPVETLRAAYLPGSLGSTRDAQTLNLVLASRLQGLAARFGGDLQTLWPWQEPGELTATEQDEAGRTSSVSLALASPDSSPLVPYLTASALILSADDRGELGQPGPGVELSLDGLASVSGTRGEWTLELDVAQTAGTILVTPEDVTVEGGSGVTADLALSRTGGAPAILGADGGTRLELGTPRIAAGVELTDRPDVSFEFTLEDAALVVTAGDGDSFVADALSALEMRADFDIGIAWSRSGGLRLAGGTELTFHIPIGLDLGGVVFLDSLDATLELGGEELALELGVNAELVLGPFEVRVEGIGLRTILGFPPDRGGNLGFADLELGFLPPTGVGMDLDLEGAGGSAYISIDPDTGRYVGAGAFDFAAVGLAAVVVVDTQLPGDPDGWALFCSLSLTFPSVPLGFGFFLSGVGGLVCLNRTMDVEALAGGLSSGAVDAILFPEEPEKDAALIVSQLDSWFPLAEGSLVFGVAGRITWGTPKTLVTADVGVVLSFPELDFAVMGSVSIELPEETDALLELNMDVIGTIDLSEGTVMVVAALHDSSLLKTLQLSGGMAMYASFGAHPYFLLSVGGYHPDFQPPAELPAAVTELDRMRVELELSENAWFALEAYFAITSNTLQFGSEATLELSDKFLGVTYTARGSVGFDVLLVFSPFSFSAGIHAGVAITAGSGDKELLAVDLSARLEGPEPWHATGRASFDFFGLNASIEIEIGGTAGVEAQPPVDLLTEVETALRDPAAWHGTSPTGADTGAVLLTAEEPPAAGQVWVRPDAELEVVQTVAPLERQLDRYGIYAIDGDSLLTITEAGLGGEVADHEPVLDWFAPAQYDDYKTNAERLAAPSYEEMTGGLRFGTEGVSLSPDSHNRSVTPDYEVKILDEDKTREQPLGQLAAPLDRVTAPLTLDTTRRGLPGRNATSTHFTIEQPSWTIANATTGTAITTTGTYRDTLNTLHTTTATDPTTRATQRLAPTHTVLETT